MRAYLPDFQVIHPGDLGEALDALASGENTIPLAGGTDVMANLERGLLKPCTFLNLQDIAELQARPKIKSGMLILGALTTFRDARMTPAIRETAPLLAAAAAEVGVLAIQSRATWAGNIINASPAADGVPALIAYDAEIELASTRGTRRTALAKFYAGYKQMDRRSDELVTSIRLPLPSPGWREYYRKVAARRYQAVSKTLLAGRVLLGQDRQVTDIRLVLASVAPHTLRAFGTEEVIRGKELTPGLIDEACSALQEEICPIDDIRSTAAYRRRVTGNLLREFLSRSLIRNPLPTGSVP
jgi:CO/xanthine dehydrogenase FAD-binding subunit